MYANVLLRRFALGFALLLTSTAFTSAQEQTASPPNGRIWLDVVVTPKGGRPVPDLDAKSFTLLDNKVPQTITSFRAISRNQSPVEVLIVVDAINSTYPRVSQIREYLDKFLRADAGALSHPTALAFATDTGLRMQEQFSLDGNALSTGLDNAVVGLRSVTRSTGFYGAEERFQLSLETLRQLVGREEPRPGRKVIIWISAGWPLFASPTVQLDAKNQQQLFGAIVKLSTEMLRARVTLYSIDPSGNDDFARAHYVQQFLKGVSEPKQVQTGNLALPVLAVQSGGLALSNNNDITAMVHDCITDIAAYYEISFDPPHVDKRDEYHPLEVRVADAGLTARTRQGYYAQPMRTGGAK
jgi:VWFA-related protein